MVWKDVPSLGERTFSRPLTMLLLEAYRFEGGKILQLQVRYPLVD